MNVGQCRLGQRINHLTLRSGSVISGVRQSNSLSHTVEAVNWLYLLPMQGQKHATSSHQHLPGRPAKGTKWNMMMVLCFLPCITLVHLTFWFTCKTTQSVGQCIDGPLVAQACLHGHTLFDKQGPILRPMLLHHPPPPPPHTHTHT